jgi:bacterioferritin-associated ferredoxin
MHWQNNQEHRPKLEKAYLSNQQDRYSSFFAELNRSKAMTAPDEMVCYCGGVPRSKLVEAIRDGARTLKDIQQATGGGLGSRCKELNPKGVCCHQDILAILKEMVGSGETSSGCCCRTRQNNAT